MVYLNYTNLDAETQERLMANSKDDVKQKLGKTLLEYARNNNVDFETLVEEEAIKNLYSYDYVFNI